MKDDKKINIFAVDKIIALGKMFEKEGYELGSLFLKDSDLSFKKKVLDLHSSAITKNTIAFVTQHTDEKVHLLWFKLDSRWYDAESFEAWKPVKESIEYNESKDMK